MNSGNKGRYESLYADFLCSCAIIPTRFIWNRNMEKRSYLCIDLKSFYASVECVERGLDPFKVNLVVADPERGFQSSKINFIDISEEF